MYASTKRFILEHALESGELDRVQDLLQPSGLLGDLWDTSSVRPLLLEPRKVVAFSGEHLNLKRTSKQEIEDEQSKRRVTESNQLQRVLVDQIFPAIQSRKPSSYPNERGYIRATSETVDKHGSLVVECGTALCTFDGLYQPNVLVRLVVVDFMSEATVLDVSVSVPEGYDVVDIRPTLTGLDAVSSASSSFEDARNMLLSLMSDSTILLSSNLARNSEALQLDHSRWISLNELFQVDQNKKRQGESKFHVRNVLSVPQILQVYLGEASYDRLKVLAPKNRLIENCVGLARVVKAVARNRPESYPLIIEPPRRFKTIFLSHIPSDWSHEDIQQLMPGAFEVEPVEFFLDPVVNEWRGETHAFFKSEADVTATFSKLTSCTDVFVGWEWSACGKVTTESLRALGEDFGAVIGVRIPDKYLDLRVTAPSKDSESRPFGFISMAKFQQAMEMAKEPRQILKDDISYHVKISKKPITAFKRVPLGEAEDYFEAFIM